MISLKPTLSAAQAREMIETSKSKANALNVPCSIAVIGPDGYLLSFERQDGAISGSVELAINKAFTAQIFNNGTDALSVLAQPGAELFGIQHSHNGRVVVFGGGIAIQFQGQAIGAIGVSGGTVAEDVAIAEAGAGILSALLVDASALCAASNLTTTTGPETTRSTHGNNNERVSAPKKPGSSRRTVAEFDAASRRRPILARTAGLASPQRGRQ